MMKKVLVLLCVLAMVGVTLGCQKKEETPAVEEQTQEVAPMDQATEEAPEVAPAEEMAPEEETEAAGEAMDSMDSMDVEQPAVAE